MTDWFGPASAQEYLLDAWQRSVLFLDVLRTRGNIYLEHSSQKVPHVLDFEVELVIDGRTLPRPVNYRARRGSNRPQEPGQNQQPDRSSSSIRAPATAPGSVA